MHVLEQKSNHHIHQKIHYKHDTRRVLQGQSNAGTQTHTHPHTHSHKPTNETVKLGTEAHVAAGVAVLGNNIVAAKESFARCHHHLAFDKVMGV